MSRDRKEPTGAKQIRHLFKERDSLSKALKAALKSLKDANAETLRLRREIQSMHEDAAGVDL